MRRDDLNLLHVLGCCTIFVYHVLLIFAPCPLYHLKNGAISQPLEVVYNVAPIPLSLFFVLAGWLSLGSVRRRGAGSFLRKRLLRVFVPLVSGMLLLCPFIKYVELLNGRTLQPSGMELAGPTQLTFFQFLPWFYTRMNYTTWSHLWFLAYLMLYCVIFLPVLIGLAQLDWGTRVTRLPGWLAYLPVVPLAMVLGGLHGWWPFYPNLWKDWVNFGYFGLCFFTGAIMAACPAFEQCIHSNWLPLGLIGAAGFVGVISNVETTIGRVFVAVAAWGCTACSLGLASRFHSVQNKALDYLRQATLPFYVLHHTVVLVIGWYVIHLEIGIGLKIAILLPTAFLVTLAIYEGIIRRFSAPRFLFGMPPVSAARPDGQAAISQRVC